MNRTSNDPSTGLMPLDAQQMGGDDPQSASGGSGGGGGGGVFRLETMAPGVANAEQAMVGPRKRKISTQVIALAALLAIGGGMIYAMRLLGIGPLTSLAKTVVPDYDLTRPGSRTADHKKILQDLAADHAASQVPVSEVQKNPFRMADVVGTPAPAPTDSIAAGRAAAERARREADQKKARVQGVLAQLKINGIIGGSNPVARISGDAVRVGDTVGEGGLFTVKAIHGRSVELESEGAIYELSMDDETTNSNRHKK